MQEPAVADRNSMATSSTTETTSPEIAASENGNGKKLSGVNRMKKRLGFEQVSKAWFNLVHRSNLVYNTCWEDPRLDHVALELTPEDTVMVITSAGCNALDYAIEGPKHVYAIDVNPKQNALLEMKQTCIRQLDFEQFFSLFGEGHLTGFKDVYQSKIRPELSEAARSFWDRRTRFFSGKGKRPSFYFYGSSGMFAWLINFYVDRVKKLRPVVDELLSAPDVATQKEIYDKHNLGKTLWTPFLKWAMKRDMTLAMLGVPRAQRKQLDRDYPGGILQFVVDSIETVFTKLPLKDNYFWHVYLTGKYTRECCPRYLEEEHFNKLKGGLVDRVTTHTDTVLGYLRENEVEVSRYILLDHMDWLAEVKSDILEAEWQAMIDRAAPKTRFMWRSAGMSVEFVDPIPVEVNGQKRTMGDMLTYNTELAAELHPIDRVHTYGSFYIADYDPNKTAQ